MNSDVIQRLAGSRTVANADAFTGRFDVEHHGSWVSVHLPPDLLSHYAASLGYPLDPAFSTASEARKEQLRAQHLVILLEEFIDSDLDQSLVGLHLIRRADGTVDLADRRAAPRTPVMPFEEYEGGYWTSAREVD